MTITSMWVGVYGAECSRNCDICSDDVNRPYHASSNPAILEQLLSQAVGGLELVYKDHSNIRTNLFAYGSWGDWPNPENFLKQHLGPEGVIFGRTNDGRMGWSTNLARLGDEISIDFVREYVSCIQVTLYSGDDTINDKIAMHDGDLAGIHSALKDLKNLGVPIHYIIRLSKGSTVGAENEVGYFLHYCLGRKRNPNFGIMYDGTIDRIFIDPMSVEGRMFGKDDELITRGELDALKPKIGKEVIRYLLCLSEIPDEAIKNLDLDKNEIDIIKQNAIDWNGGDLDEYFKQTEDAIDGLSDYLDLSKIGSKIISPDHRSELDIVKEWNSNYQLWRDTSKIQENSLLEAVISSYGLDKFRVRLAVETDGDKTFIYHKLWRDIPYSVLSQELNAFSKLLIIGETELGNVEGLANLVKSYIGGYDNKEINLLLNEQRDPDKVNEWVKKINHPTPKGVGYVKLGTKTDQ